MHPGPLRKGNYVEVPKRYLPKDVLETITKMASTGMQAGDLAEAIEFPLEGGVTGRVSVAECRMIGVLALVSCIAPITDFACSCWTVG